MNESPLPGKGAECANHPGIVASTTCIVCGKPVCADCSVEIAGTMLCEDPEHRTILADWVVATRTHSEFEADMIVRNLEYQGIRTRVFSSRVFKWRIGLDADDFVNVFVHRNQHGVAREVLIGLGVADTVANASQPDLGGPDNV